MSKKAISVILALILIISVFGGCQQNGEPSVSEPVEEVPEEEPVTLKVVGAWTDFKALEVVAKAFNEKYPNCTVQYEYLQDYYEILEKRLQSGTDPIDLFLTFSIQPDSALLPYALDFYSVPETDLSGTYEGLIRNFEFRDTDSNSLYTIPLGAEMRGMYVNKTLLNSLGIEVPTKLSEFMEACRILKENGYVPLHGNPGAFGQQLMYPYICNIIANAEDYDAVYNMVNSREAGLSSLFADPFSILYKIMTEKYYDYKYVENELGMFTDSSNEGYARYFFNISGTDGNYEKVDDIGTVAFMPSSIALESTLLQFKSDFHSEIEFEFILSPLSENGGFAYLSPAHGIAANKNSENVDWAVKFINFLFEPENNELFADNFHIIPNTKDAFSIITNRFDIPENHVSQLGQVTFDYGFYAIVCDSLVSVSKGNNPKYMDKDGTEFYPLEYYMDNLETALTTVE